MVNYFKIVEIVEDLRNTTKSTEKLAILKANKDNKLLQKVLEYTYNPYKKYKITEDTFSKYNSFNCDFDDIFDLLNLLAKSNINDYLRNEAVGLVNLAEPRLRDLFKCMLVKDLRIGCNAKTINKVWEGLIPEFGCMLAESIFKNDNIKKIEGKEFSISTKLDGFRILAFKENNEVVFYTRQGQQYIGLVEIKEDLKNIPDNIVIDGELLLKDIPEDMESGDVYKATSKIARKKGEKRGLCLNAFDIIDKESFFKGKDCTPHKVRRERLHEFIENNNFKFLKEVKELYRGKDINKIYELLDEARENGEEGIMVSLSSGVYEIKRSKQLLKVKIMESMDVRVLDVYEGEGNFKSMLGGVIFEFEHENNIYKCNCGSGFSQEDRVRFWNNRDEILDKIIELQYFEVTQNKDGGYGLRFPVFKGIRDDKTEPSYH